MQSSRYHKRSRLELFTRATIAHRWLSRQPFLSQDQHLVRKCVFNPCLDRVLTRTVGKHINIESATEVARYLSKFALACGETLQTMEEAIFTYHDTKEKKKEKRCFQEAPSDRLQINQSKQKQNGLYYFASSDYRSID